MHRNMRHAGLWFGLASLLLAGCGGGASNPVVSTGAGAAPAVSSTVNQQEPQATTVTLKRSTPMGVLVPLYGYPLVSSGSGSTYTTSENPAWTEVADYAAAVPTVAIINPKNGPVACTTPPSATLSAFTQGISRLHSAGVKVLGYVHTSYGTRALSLVQQDVQTYAQCYGVDGVFFDEISNKSGLASYYATAAATVRQDIQPGSGQPALVAINPGTYPDLAIAQTADITVMHESEDLDLAAAPASLGSYPSAKFAYLALRISNLAQTQAATLSSLYRQGVGYVYLTDQGNGNDPWAKLSTSYPAQIQIIQALNQSKN